ncbi:MAG: hypothetical protein CVV53_06245 [Spirochaetae bacterium HGW-Spirochaetae-9]|nr:MAG: hypothetical protein CVV53_06245 [Spirochaetae bacterium HGW-Spirochaetae-9]
MNHEPGTVQRFIRAIRRHRLEEILLLSIFWVALAVTDIRLKALPYRFNRRLLHPGRPNPKSGARKNRRGEARMQAISRLVAQAASRHGVFNMTCLRRAIVLRSILRLTGIDAALIYGMRRTSGTDSISAHAWLDAGGIILDCGAPARSFKAFGQGRDERKPSA